MHTAPSTDRDVVSVARSGPQDGTRRAQRRGTVCAAGAHAQGTAPGTGSARGRVPPHAYCTWLPPLLFLPSDAGELRVVEAEDLVHQVGRDCTFRRCYKARPTQPETQQASLHFAPSTQRTRGLHLKALCMSQSEACLLPLTLARLVGITLDFPGDPGSVPFSSLSSAGPCGKPTSTTGSQTESWGEGCCFLPAERPPVGTATTQGLTGSHGDAPGGCCYNQPHRPKEAARAMEGGLLRAGPALLKPEA